MVSEIVSLVSTPNSSRPDTNHPSVARLWNEICGLLPYKLLAVYRVIPADSTRFINYYGERNARLYRPQMVDEEESSIFMKIFFLLLFDAPSTYLSTIRKVYIDNVLYGDDWRKYVETTCNNWHDMILWVGAPFYLANY